VLRCHGKYEEAELMNRRALEGYERVLGKEHPDTLKSVDNLAYFFHGQKRFREATMLYEKACSGFMKVLGPSHPLTTNCAARYSSLRAEMVRDGQNGGFLGYDS
jgi:hypothetical protein